jgi:hypothetical protein
MDAIAAPSSPSTDEIQKKYWSSEIGAWRAATSREWTSVETSRQAFIVG